MEFVRTTGIAELGTDVLGALIGVVAFFAVYRVSSVTTFRWQRRALRLLMVAAACFSLARILSIAERMVRSGALEALVSVAHSVVAMLIALCVGLTGYALLRSEREEISSLRRSAEMDDLTSLPNRAYFRRAAERRFALFRENNVPLSCAVLDIDDFKPYNDEFGHEAGDRALACVGEVLRGSARADDIAARYGGEEFVMLLNSTLEDAALVAERIRLEVEQRCSPGSDTQIKRQITVSSGVVFLDPGVYTIDDFVRAADEEMYRAKRTGKNRVSVARRA